MIDAMRPKSAHFRAYHAQFGAFFKTASPRRTAPLF